MKITREQWLERAVNRLRPAFKAAGAAIPATVRVSCGWPSVSARSAVKRRIGECWDPSAAADKRAHIFISPSMDDAGKVLATLVHELVHAAVGCKVGHRAPFQKVAGALGLREPWTATHAGPELADRLKGLAKKLGRYPHGALRFTSRKKQTTRMLKAECGDCGYLCRLTQKWVDEAGPPICPTCEEKMQMEDK